MSVSFVDNERHLYPDFSIYKEWKVVLDGWSWAGLVCQERWWSVYTNKLHIVPLAGVFNSLVTL
jgi:hypothetical protein